MLPPHLNRRAFIGMIVSGVVTAPLIAKAQLVKTVRSIGFLGPGVPESSGELQEKYAPLRELGWIEGQNLVFERRYTNGKSELLRPLAEELVRLKVDLIVTEGTAATLAAKSATDVIPIVFRTAGDPVRSGLVRSLARPGGNVTGYSIVSPQLDAKRLAVLHEILPGVQRVGVLENSTNPYTRAAREDLAEICKSLGIQPIFVEVAAATELENAVAEVARRGGQALFVPPETLFYQNRRELMAAALKHRLPGTVARLLAREMGALVSYAPTQAEENDRAIAFIDRILRGAKPGELPVEQPTKFDLIINLKTAKALGIIVPQTLLSRASEVIQ